VTLYGVGRAAWAIWIYLRSKQSERPDLLRPIILHLFTGAEIIFIGVILFLRGQDIGAVRANHPGARSVEQTSYPSWWPRSAHRAKSVRTE